MDYWHGGAPGLNVGTHLESFAKRRKSLRPEQRFRESFGAQFNYSELRDPNRVYFTSDRELARAWASNLYKGGGTLYRVRPVPPSSLEVDPDFPTVGFSARRAEILAVEETDVAVDPDGARRAGAKYATWQDDSPIYDDEGYLQPPPEHRALGMTADPYRHLGKWFAVIGPLMVDPQTKRVWADQPGWANPEAAGSKSARDSTST